jgi:putative DNA primase/helicase
VGVESLSLDAVRAALSVLSPADRFMRVRIGEAIKDEFGDAGFDTWDTWYQGHDRHTANEAKSAWKSFGKGGPKRCTIATLVYEAKRAGFKFTKKHQLKQTAEERARFEAERAARRAALEAEAAAQEAAAAERAAAIWAAAGEDPAGHPYLARKGIQPLGSVRRAREWVKEWTDAEGEIRTITFKDALLVPIWSAPGKLASLQAILPSKVIGREGEKRDKDYLTGGRKHGCYCVLGRVKDAAVVLVCEGYATGVSLHQATGYPVMVAFDASNLQAVAEQLRAKLPEVPIVICADNDQFTRPRRDGSKWNPGVENATAAAEACKGLVAVPQFDSLEDEPTDFNDLAQRQGEAAVHDAIELALRPPAPAPAPAEAPPWDGEEQPPAAAPAPDAPKSEGDDGGEDDEPGMPEKNGYFAVLGYDHGAYYVFVHGKRQLMVMHKGDMGLNGFLELAPLNWWEMHFPPPSEKTKIDTPAAANFLIQTAHKRGIYDPTRIRGRGAWEDEGRIVFHHGGYLSVDGVPTDITAIKSRYVYELNRSLPEPAEDALTSDEGEALLSIAERFRWATPGSAALMLGWVALAPVCGALPWRPHLWLTGGAGSGKSTVLTKFGHHLLSGIDVYALGKSTEPGIRQELKSDARPVMMDESESNEEDDVRRIQNILGLIRQASSETGAKTYKGTATGHALSFDVRSMFCLASIQVALKQKADIDRLTVLALRSTTEEEKDGAGEEWRTLREILHGLHKDRTLPARLLRRVIDQLPVTLQAITVFCDAAADKFGSQRDGDQYGTLLAGAWSLISTQVPTREQAVELIERYDWSEYRERSDEDESKRALAALLEAHIRVHGGIEVTVFELVAAASQRPTDVVDLTAPKAQAFLERHGLKVKDNHLLVSNTSVELRNLMSGTQFAADLRGLLLRTPGAIKWEKAVKFSGAVSRAIALPLEPIVGHLVVVAPDERPF